MGLMPREHLAIPTKITLHGSKVVVLLNSSLVDPQWILHLDSLFSSGESLSDRLVVVRGRALLGSTHR